MLRFFVFAIVCLIPATTIAQQNYIRTSDPIYASGWVQLHKPPALVLQQRFGASPQKHGIYEIAATFVNEQGRISKMSPVTTIATPGKNCGYSFKHTHPTWQRSVGVMLWCRKQYQPGDAGPELEWRPFGGHAGCHDPQYVVKPILSMTGWSQHSLRAIPIDRCVWNWGAQAWQPYTNDLFWPKSGENGPATAPDITVYYCPDRAYEVAYSWAAHLGESELSDPVTVPAMGSDETVHSPFEVRREVIPPQGALGMYVYVRKQGGQWHRQPNCHDVTNFLWPVSANRIRLLRFVSSTIRPPATPNGQSWLCSLQMCLIKNTKSVIVDTDQITASPIINPINNQYGTAINRTIQGNQGLPFKITTAPIPGAATDWPVWVETSLGTTLKGCQIESNTAEVGLEFMDHGGSGSFSFNGQNLIIILTRDGYTSGIRQTWEGRSPNNHSLSDSTFTNVKIGARHPIVIEGNQSLNITFNDVNTTCYGGPECSVISLNNYAGLTVNGLTCDGGRSILTVLAANQVNLKEVFTDQGYPTYITLLEQASPQISWQWRKANHWANWVHLLESPAGLRAPAILDMTGNECQHNGTVASTIYTGRYCGVRFSLSPLSLFSSFTHAQPTFDQWQVIPNLATGQSYYHSWDAGQDIVNQAPRPNVYGK